MLWHERVGPILASSLTQYVMIEERNMQPNPDPLDFPLTLRLEAQEGGLVYSNLYDLASQISYEEGETFIDVYAQVQLRRKEAAAPLFERPLQLRYRFEREALRIWVRTEHDLQPGRRIDLVVPLISPRNERYTRTSETNLSVEKPGGQVVLSATQVVRVIATPANRIFNHVSGFEAIPLAISWEPSIDSPLEVTLQVLG